MSAPSRKDDCLPCRLVSGFGLLGISVYLYSHSKKSGKIGYGVISILSAGAFATGIARLLNVDFLKSQHSQKPQKEDKS